MCFRGFRRGHWWLWWALLSAGSIAYLATIIVHWQVGYTSLKHLIPAYAGLGILWAGCALSREQLCWQDVLDLDGRTGASDPNNT
ncbi:MAG TPA: hypothetical protein VMM56_00190 [Planctomycetaceae bacterium]|nr:hypothetical protein [Planctomycetaceae bacterium]